jgi:hypothetical protein
MLILGGMTSMEYLFVSSYPTKVPKLQDSSLSISDEAGCACVKSKLNLLKIAVKVLE